MKTIFFKTVSVLILFFMGTTYSFELINAYDSFLNILGLVLLLSTIFIIYWVIKFKKSNKSIN